MESIAGGDVLLEVAFVVVDDAMRDTELADWMQLVRSEYLESPGLCLTHRQAQRLWNLGPSRCEAVLEAPVAARFLRQTANGLYVRWDSER